MDRSRGLQTVEPGPWNPGIRSQVPRDLLHLSTIFRAENVYTRVSDAEELRDLTGFELADLVAFRPRRLALHELLIRVTADFSVPDGARIEDLGINFRQIIATLLERCVAPNMEAIEAEYAARGRASRAMVDRELARLLRPAPAPPPSRRRTAAPAAQWQRADAAEEPTPTASSASSPNGSAGPSRTRIASTRPFTARLLRVVSALLVRHGRAWGSRELVASLATDIACNDSAAKRSAGCSTRGWRARRAPKATRCCRAGRAGRDEHQGRVRRGQEHAAAAAEEARRRDRRATGASSR